MNGSNPDFEAQQQAIANREQARFEKAEKLEETDYEDPVWWDSYGPADGFFVSTEDVHEYCEENEMPTPRYVWACAPETFHIDVQGVVETELERQEMFEDAYETLGGEAAIKELQALVDDWHKKHPCVGWMPDYKRAVLLAPQ